MGRSLGWCRAITRNGMNSIDHPGTISNVLRPPGRVLEDYCSWRSTNWSGTSTGPRTKPNEVSTRARTLAVAGSVK